MPRNIPNEIVMARLSIQVALTALESLLEKLEVVPRTEKTLISPEMVEACERLKAAQELLARLEDGGARESE